MGENGHHMPFTTLLVHLVVSHQYFAMRKMLKVRGHLWGVNINKAESYCCLYM